MTALVSATAAGIAARLHTIPGLRVVEYPQESVNPPMVIIRPDNIRYAQSFKNGPQSVKWIVRLLVSRISPRTGWADLYDFCDQVGPSSIAATLLADTSMGGVVDTSYMSEAGDFAAYRYDSGMYLGCEFRLETIS